MSEYEITPVGSCPLAYSAGVGRTGTFIVIDHILEQIEKELIVDIPGAITKIRQRRMYMVQNHVSSQALRVCGAYMLM